MVPIHGQHGSPTPPAPLCTCPLAQQLDAVKCMLHPWHLSYSYNGTRLLLGKEKVGVVSAGKAESMRASMCLLFILVPYHDRIVVVS